MQRFIRSGLMDAFRLVSDAGSAVDLIAISKIS